MHHYFLLTPVCEDAHTNPGSSLITDGVKYLIQQADRNAVFFNVNLLQHDEATWEYALKEADAIVLCGNPRFNLTEETEYWDWDVWSWIHKAIQAGIPIADLWAGASYTLPLRSINEMADSILEVKKNQRVLEYEQRVDLKIARDQLAQRVLLHSGGNVYRFPCSSWWAKDYHKVTPREKQIHCVTPTALHIRDWPELLPAVLRMQARLSVEKPTYVIVHDIQEYRWISQKCPEIKNLLCIYNHKDLLQFYAGVDKLISFRVHASIPALSLGAQVCHLSIDSRSIALDEFEVSSVNYEEIANEHFAPTFHRATAPRPAMLEAFREIISTAIVDRISAKKSCCANEDRQVFGFNHGLGDNANFAHLLPLYTRRGHRLTIQCTPDKHILYAPVDVEVVSTTDEPTIRHGWPHAEPTNETHPWSGNKSAANLGQPPLPSIGTVEELWEEYCSEKLDIKPYLSNASRAFVNSMVSGLPRPVILLHAMGNSGKKRKNLSSEVTLELYKHLLDRMPGTLVLLDWDDRMPRLNNYRVRHLVDEWRHLDTEELLALMTVSDLFIGIDSGPLHATRYTDLPAVGVWTHHFPANYILPRDRTLNVVLRERAGDKTRHRRIPYNIVEQLEGDEHDPAVLADFCVSMLGPPKYLPKSKIAADVQLQQFIGVFERGEAGSFSGFADRHRGFDVLLREVVRRFQTPRIVETGTIRAEEDWGGAGYSTYLLGAFCARYGGCLDSVDLNRRNCEFSLNWTRVFGEAVKVHHQKSIDFLASLEDESIDVLYQDSVDTHIPSHAKDCLDELKAAYPKLHRRSIITYDDTPWSKGAFRGKGEYAVPWLVERGWEILHGGYQVILARGDDNLGALK